MNQKAEQELDFFITEHNLQNIASDLKDAGMTVAELCSKTADEVEEIASGLTSSVDEQELFKNAVSKRQSKSKGSEQKEEKQVDQIYVKTLTGKVCSPCSYGQSGALM